MSFEKFKQDALRTESKINRVEVHWPLFIPAARALLGASEILDQVKKNTYYGKPFNETNLHESADKLSDLRMFKGIEYLESDGMKDALPVDPRVFHAIIGMVTETAELLQAMIDHMEGKPLDVVNILEELGDFDWYKAILCDVLNISEDESRERVIAKLRARYPNKFTSEAAINRNLEEERKILEGETTERKKVTVWMKDPDGVFESCRADGVDESHPAIRKFFRYGEQVRIEVDLEAGTAEVLSNS